MLHTPSYTALNRCAQEGERWSGGYTTNRTRSPLAAPSPPCQAHHHEAPVT